ncbi:MAG: cytochrome c [Methylobacteriaceae bacterium]|nr:cytochrome c [Methylobacteriaceae bacterium]MBV9221372.1 cytochrome c [Methylobacteriaceae bacterium]MBV9247445.1 cytochrome c [Methylobacteriaceae bacterium]MBV9633422.1 cytochrome c [Methylobacteriaceae bacterium]MBV9705162.1 cytochrome c [Methylobacteriaceae bacterium]
MIRSFLVAGLLTLGIGTVLAQNLDVIKERKQTMKSAGDATGDPVKMIKGELPFDLPKVQASLQTYVAVAKKMPTLFPDDSKTGDDTAALPKIWENKDDVIARYAKLGTDATAALTTIKDEASLKATFPNILKNCGGCHETYRASKS